MTLQEKRFNASLYVLGGNKGHFLCSYFDILAKSRDGQPWPHKARMNHQARAPRKSTASAAQRHFRRLGKFLAAREGRGAAKEVAMTAHRACPTC